MLRLLAAAGIMAGGCGSGGPFDDWEFDPPPFVSRMVESSDVEYRERPVMVIGRFADPTTPSVRWRDVGSGMTHEVGRALLNQGRYGVLIDLGRAATYERILQQAERRNPLDELRRAYPQATFVIAGKVTDFHDTADLPRDLSRRGLFGRKREAIAAIEFIIVDLRTGQAVAADHVRGLGNGAEAASRELYRNISFGSYLFWDTPLGEASRAAIEAMVQRLDRLLPAVVGEMLIVKHIAPRRVVVSAGKERGLVSGREYFVCRRRGPGAPPEPVTDVDSGEPLRARIDEVRGGESTAWVIGRTALQDDLIGAVLRSDFPLPVADAAAAPITSAAPGRR